MSDMLLAARLFRNETGQGVLEYGLVLALIAVAVSIGVAGVTEKVAPVFVGVAERLTLGN